MGRDIALEVDGREVHLPDDGLSLLEALRDRLGLRSPKDGCSPQGQCGCCTVLVDGAPRVACVTPLRRVAGRRITTVDGLADEERQRWCDAFVAAGASQCGFCTPGIVVRLSGLAARGTGAGETAAVERALAAHLCRCTGWRTILDAWRLSRAGGGGGRRLSRTGGSSGATPAPLLPPERDLRAAAARAALEGGVAQVVGPEVVLGRGGFADDTAPPGALVAVPDAARPGEWAVGETLAEARRAAGKVQGRRTTAGLRHPIEVPPGAWDLTLRTTWVEPAYLETDASWCEPGGEPATVLANGGAFGAKATSVAPAAARRLAGEHGRPVRVLLSREDTVRLGPKRPPLAAGLRSDGSGVVHVARTPGIAAAIAAASPGLDVVELDVAGPPTSAALRAAGWAEALVLGAALAGTRPVVVTSPAGANAEAHVDERGVRVRVDCGAVLDEVVLRSYCVGAVHMALGWVRREGIAVDGDGVVGDLTIRSFGILGPADTPEVAVEVVESERPAVNGSDAVFAAVAAAEWMRQGCPPSWPVERSEIP
ncbi:MAG TPA: 2Fe-2S iron-sulfur cluster-binding protein [Acidimicrobiales bacterium]|nr:2Fe-2S iron-sulfur cluster-binding protein [Acidimicrobiales bacterium]